MTYPNLRGDCLPSVPIQLWTFVFYAVVIAGLCLYRRREPSSAIAVPVNDRELRRVLVLFGVTLVLALISSPLADHGVLFLPILPNFAIWTPLGFLLTVLALIAGARDRFTCPACNAPV